MQKLSFRRTCYDRVLKFFLYLCALLTCALLLFVIGYIFTGAWAISAGSF